MESLNKSRLQKLQSRITPIDRVMYEMAKQLADGDGEQRWLSGFLIQMMSVGIGAELTPKMHLSYTEADSHFYECKETHRF